MSRRTIYILAVILVGIIAGGYRLYAANRLFVDIDEPTYLQAGLKYDTLLRHGQYQQVAESLIEYEHPLLNKLLFGAVLLPQNPADNLKVSELALLGSSSKGTLVKWDASELSLAMADRYLSVFFGTAAVILLALVNPVAGFFLAVQTLSVKYTSEIYLEAVPLLTSLLCALAYVRWVANVTANPSEPHRSQYRWLLASAVFLGLTAASKYVYCVVGLGIVIHFLAEVLQKKMPWRSLGWLVGWGVLSFAFFFLFDPFLWVDPRSKMFITIDFHLHLQHRVYTGSLANSNSQFPFWQPLRWLFSPASFYDLGPLAVFKLNLDILIALLALIGAPRFFRNRRLFFYWFLAGLVFLFFWGAKWPQYTLIILAPFCLAAADGVQTLWLLAQRWLPHKADPL